MTQDLLFFVHDFQSLGILAVSITTAIWRTPSMLKVRYAEGLPWSALGRLHAFPINTREQSSVNRSGCERQQCSALPVLLLPAMSGLSSILRSRRSDDLFTLKAAGYPLSFGQSPPNPMTSYTERLRYQVSFATPGSDCSRRMVNIADSCRT